MTNFMTPGDAARMLGVTTTWLRSFDAELQPERTLTGHRRYNIERVRAFAEARAARRNVSAGR